jgi:hypothetical protein
MMVTLKFKSKAGGIVSVNPRNKLFFLPLIDNSWNQNGSCKWILLPSLTHWRQDSTLKTPNAAKEMRNSDWWTISQINGSQTGGIYTFYFFFHAGIDLRASSFLGRHSTTWATPPALFCVGYFWDRVLILLPGLALNYGPPDLCLPSI